MLCCFSLKKSRKLWRISEAVILGMLNSEYAMLNSKQRDRADTERWPTSKACRRYSARRDRIKSTHADDSVAKSNSGAR